MAALIHSGFARLSAICANRPMRLPHWLLGVALILTCAAAFAANFATEPTGEYAKIDTKPITAAMEKLLKGTPEEKKATMDEIVAHSDRFAPPVLCALGSTLAAEERMDDAMFWFYAGQLRARFDIRRCADPTVGGVASILTQQYGAPINSYGFKHPAELKKAVQRAVTWDADTPYNYDQRWVNLHGMGAVTGDQKSASSVDEKTWPALAKATRETYWSGFRLAIGDNPEDFFADPKALALAKAAIAGDTAAIDASIKDGADVNALGKDDATPLWFAYLAGNRTGFVQLLDRGADATRVFKAMRTSVLESALHREDDDYLTLLLAHKVDANAKDHLGNPILCAVAGYASLSKVQLLAEHGANVNATDKSGTTPATHASQMRQYDTLSYLLDHGADPDLQDKLGRDIAVGLFAVPNLPPAADAKRREIVAKLTARGYKFDDAAIAQARTISNLKEATGQEPPKFLKSAKGINPAWLAKHPEAAAPAEQKQE
jgi:hypothetical protein